MLCPGDGDGDVLPVRHAKVRLMFAAGTGWVSQLSDWLDRVSGHWWFLALIALIAVIDSVIPIVPSETAVIIGGVAAGSGHYSLWWVIGVAAFGAFVGDNLAYEIGRTAGPWFERRAARKPKFRKRLDWAHAQISKRGGLLLITARFIPGGRTALTVTSGVTHQKRWWFIRWIALAAAIWASYAALLGYVGGRAFQDDHTKAFVAALIIGVSATVAIEVVRNRLERRRTERDKLEGDGAKT